MLSQPLGERHGDAMGTPLTGYRRPIHTTRTRRAVTGSQLWFQHQGNLDPAPAVRPSHPGCYMNPRGSMHSAASAAANVGSPYTNCVLYTVQNTQVPKVRSSRVRASPRLITFSGKTLVPASRLPCVGTSRPPIAEDNFTPSTGGKTQGTFPNCPDFSSAHRPVP